MFKRFTLLTVVGLFSLASPVFADVPVGTVVLGDKAFELDYANNPANQTEIVNALVQSGGKVYIKGFTGTWIDNITQQTVDKSTIPALVYKSSQGTKYFEANDGAESSKPTDPNGDFEVVGIE